jgi:hypothetical protein
MRVLVENNIPYRTSNYQHPRYKRYSRVAVTTQQNQGFPATQQNQGFPATQQSQGFPATQQNQGAPATQQNQGAPATQSYNYQQFAQSLQQEAAQWQSYEINRALKSIATHAKAAGFPPAEVSQLQQNFQRVAQQENIQTAMYMALNYTDILHSAHKM